MIQLVVYAQSKEKQTVLDLKSPGSISLNFEVGKVGDVVGRYSPFSQSFSLPFTNTNNKFFRQYYNINNQGYLVLEQGQSGFNPDYKAKCQIRVDGIPVITGSLQLTKCSVKERTYEVVVYGAEAGLFRAIEDKKLVDAFKDDSGLIVSDYNVNLSDENVIDSWDDDNDVTQGGVGNGIIMLPLIDYGFVGDYNFIYAEDDPIAEYGLADINFLFPYHFKPAINIRHLFEKICNKAGYTLTNNSFLTSSAWDKLYMTLGTDRESCATTSLFQSQVGNTTTTNILNWGMVAGTNGSWQEVPLVTQSGTSTNPPVFYDPGDDWNTDGQFIPPFDGAYHGVLYCTFDSGPASIAEGASVKIRITNNMGFNTAELNEVNLTGNDGGDPIYTTLILPFNIWGDGQLPFSIEVRASCESGYSVNLVSDNTYCKILASTTAAGVADIPANMPDISQKDFLTDIIERFNLAIVSDDGENDKLFIMPWLEYLQAGTRKDWTDKLDLSKKRDIIPTTNIKKKFINFSDAEDEDIRNKDHLDQYGKVFGSYSQEIKGDYVKGELKNSPIFSPWHVGQIPRQDNANISDLEALIHKSYSQGTEGPLSSCKPKLYYYNGLGSTGHPIYIGDNVAFSYPLCLPFLNGGDQMAEDSPLLYWQFQTPISWGHETYGSTPSSEGYFKRYWQKFLADIYHKDARILECSLNLTPTDLLNFKFNDEVVIEDTAYRVQKISGYQPFSNDTTKVTLIKKIFALDSLQITDVDPECEATPNAFYADGTVTFWDYVQDQQVVSEICCEEYGYFWDGTDCYWDYGGGGGGSGDPTTGLGGGGVPGDVTPSDPVGGKSTLYGVGGFLSRKSGSAPNVNPVSGEHGTRGQNRESFSNTVTKSFVYYATSKDSTATKATPNGFEGEKSGLMIPYDTMARFTIRALSVQTHVISGGSGSYGSSSFNVWTFLVKNVAGVITIVGSSEQTDFKEADADAGSRTLDIVGASGKTGFAGTRGVDIECTGPADSILAWHLDIEATYMDFGYSKNLEDLILTEDLNFIVTENGYYLEQE